MKSVHNNTDRELEIVRVSGYPRTSTNRQEKEGTIDSQREQIYDYVRVHFPYIKPDDILMFEDDGWSGATLERPGMDELLASLKEDTWDVLVVPDPDRLARDPYLQFFVIEEIEKAGKKIVFCTTEAPDRNNEDQRMMFELRGMLSKYEKVRINARFRTGKLRKAKKYVMLSEAPYGYILVKRYEDPVTKVRTETHIVINEVEAKVIKLIFIWYVHDKLSMRQIASKLKEIGAVPRNNANGDWNTSTIGNILRNTTYIGEAHYRKTQAVEPKKPIRKLYKKRRRDKKTSRIMRPEEQWMKLEVPAILETDDDKNLFYLAQEQRKKNSQMCSRNRKNDYLLGGKIYCTCGAARTGEGPQGGKYLYYRCGGRHNNQSTAHRKCELQAVNAKIADDAIWNTLIQLLTTRSFLRNQLELFYKMKSGSDSISEKIVELETKIDDYNKRIVELKQFVLDDKLPVNQYSELRNEVDAKLVNLKSELVEVKAKSERTSRNLISPDEFELVLDESFTQIYGLKFEQKRAIVVQLIDEVVAEPGHLTVTGYIGLSSSSEVQDLEGVNYSSNSSENHVKFKTSGGDGRESTRYRIDLTNPVPLKRIPFRLEITIPMPLRTGYDYGFPKRIDKK